MRAGPIGPDVICAALNRLINDIFQAADADIGAGMRDGQTFHAHNDAGLFAHGHVRHGVLSGIAQASCDAVDRDMDAVLHALVATTRAVTPHQFNLQVVQGVDLGESGGESSGPGPGCPPGGSFCR
jgi:hypothetical protein